MDEDKGRKVHVDTVEGKYDLHYEKTGEFAPKDGKETYDAETDKYESDKSSESGDGSFDAKSLFSDMKLDDDLEAFDAAAFTDMKFDDDLDSLDESIDIEERIKNSTTLKNYRKAREKRIAKLRTRWSLGVATAWRDKMREIMQHTTVISRIPEDKILNLIETGEYMNQFGTRRSEGSYTATDFEGGYRGTMTRTCFGTVTAGTTMEDRKKWEKYGTMCPDGDYDGIMDRRDKASSYGEISCIYKKDKVKGLVTYTMSDSLSFERKEMCPILMEDDSDEFCMGYTERTDVTKDKISKCKNIYDVVDMINPFSYGEAQIHVDKITLDYFDAIAIPYNTLNGYASTKIKSAMKIAKEKYPDLKFTSRDKSGKARVITVDDDGNYVYGDVYEMPK